MEQERSFKRGQRRQQSAGQDGELTLDTLIQLISAGNQDLAVALFEALKDKVTAHITSLNVPVANHQHDNRYDQRYATKAELTTAMEAERNETIRGQNQLRQDVVDLVNPLEEELGWEPTTLE